MILENPAENSHFANFLQDLTPCFGEIAPFEQKIRQIADVAGIDLGQFEIDHLAVRMNDWQTAEQWEALLLKQGKLLKESEVNGRPIGIFQLNQPIHFCGQSVSIIELPFPKDKTYPEEGWEHIEIVVPFLPNESVEQWVERLCKGGSWQENVQIKLKVSQPKAAGEQLPNPSIAISLNNVSLCNPCCIKLHPYAITTIIYA
ncbi:MAG: VOC family protein [Pasteurellaceae bacterium]|nr:VOC family protein [Pasteurellaceae bacterium]